MPTKVTLCVLLTDTSREVLMSILEETERYFIQHNEGNGSFVFSEKGPFPLQKFIIRINRRGQIWAPTELKYTLSGLLTSKGIVHRVSEETFVNAEAAANTYDHMSSQ